MAGNWHDQDQGTKHDLYDIETGHLEANARRTPPMTADTREHEEVVKRLRTQAEQSARALREIAGDEDATAEGTEEWKVADLIERLVAEIPAARAEASEAMREAAALQLDGEINSLRGRIQRCEKNHGHADFVKELKADLAFFLTLQAKIRSLPSPESAS